MNKNKRFKICSITLKFVILVIFIFSAYIYINSFLTAKYLSFDNYTTEEYDTLDIFYKGDLNQFNCKDPQNLFVNYYYKSLGIWLGNYKSYYQLVNCISPDIIKINDYIKDQQSINIDTLLVVLLETSFSISEVPKTATSNKLNLTLGKGWNKQTFYLKKKNNGDWYFTKENFINPKTFEKLERYKKEKKVSADNIRNISMPILSYLNFLLGVKQLFGFKIHDSLATMDLQWIPIEIRIRHGKFIAYAMNKVFDSAGIVLADIPGETLPGNNTIMLYMSPETKDSVYLKKIINDKQGTSEWKFPKQAQLNALKIYFNDLNITNPRELRVSLPHNIWENIPTLLNSKFGKKIYISIIYIISFMLFYFTYKIFIFLFNKALKLLGYVLGDDDFRYSTRLSVAASLMISLYVGEYFFFNSMVMHLNTCLYLYYIFMCAYAVILIFLCTEIVNVLSSYVISFHTRARKTLTANRLAFVVMIANKVINLIIVIFIAGYFLQQLGVNMIHFLAALGIGGLAIALAGKDTVGNIFGSIMLAVERPFKIGDWVILEGQEGTVEGIGLRSTRIRTFEDSVLIIPNYAFITSKINNMEERKYRRYMTMLEIDESTPTEKLKDYVRKLHDLVQNTSYMRKEDYFIRVNDIGSTSIDILIYVFFISADWGEELKQRERFIIDILDIAEKMNVTLAPNQKVKMLNDKNINSKTKDKKQLSLSQFKHSD